ncbi:MAG: hypothetical protein HRK26_02260 [Rickettsiaceae bacterium H1]|nr:hypothetical protein [Rickettsiaceae bacterium H1]
MRYGVKGNITNLNCETLSIQSEFWKNKGEVSVTQDYFDTTIISSLHDVVRNVPNITDSVLNSSVSLVLEFTSGSTERLVSFNNTGNAYSGRNDKDDNENFGLGTLIVLALSSAAIGFGCGLLLRRLYRKYMTNQPSTAIDHPEEEELKTERVTEFIEL